MKSQGRALLNWQIGERKHSTWNHGTRKIGEGTKRTSGEGWRTRTSLITKKRGGADAFSAAFKRMHGSIPQAARDPAASVKFFGRLTFTFMITGAREMDVKVVEKEEFQVVGVRKITPYGGGTWGIVKADGTAEKLQALCGHPCDLGLCFGFDEEGKNEYMCGILYQGKEAQDWDRYLFPPLCWLQFTAKGTITSGILGQVWKRIYGEFLPQSDYRQLDYPTIEQYVDWNEQEDHCHVDIFIPVSH